MTKFKEIKVVPENEDAIEEALLAVNGRATAHTYTTYNEVAYVAREAEKRLDSLLYKKDFPGAVFVSTSGNSVATSYRGVRCATRITLLRRTTGWFLTGVHSDGLYSEAGKQRLIFKPHNRDAAVKLFIDANFEVDEPKANQQTS